MSDSARVQRIEAVLRPLALDESDFAMGDAVVEQVAMLKSAIGDLDADSEPGTTVIDSNVAEQAIQDDLDGRSEFVASRVSTYQVRGTPVLKISVTCRRGVSPRDVTTIIERTLTAFDALLGHQIPALIQISGGMRARFSGTTRTQ